MDVQAGALDRGVAQGLASAGEYASGASRRTTKGNGGTWVPADVVSRARAAVPFDWRRSLAFKLLSMNMEVGDALHRGVDAGSAVQRDRNFVRVGPRGLWALR